VLSFIYATRSYAEKYKYHYEYFPLLEQWRLFVDGDKQNIPTELNGLGFENREPGYMNAMFKAFSYIRATAGAQISEEFIKKLHFYCTSGVQFSARGGRDVKKIQPGEYYSRKADLHSGFQLHLRKNASESGIVELLNTMSEDSGLCITIENPENFSSTTINSEWIETHGMANAIKLLKSYSCPLRVCTQTTSTDEISLKLKLLIENFNFNIKNAANTKHTKLILIISFIRRLVWLHPFQDANTRVFVMQLLNKCLVENGFPPTILDNPNDFDGHGIEELVNMTKIGFSNFNFVKEQHYWPNTASTINKAKL